MAPMAQTRIGNPSISLLGRALLLLLCLGAFLRGSESPRDEVLLGFQRALLHREKQPDFRYHGIEYRRTGHWLQALPQNTTQYLGLGLGRPERDFGSYLMNLFGGLRQTLLQEHGVKLYAQADTGVFLSDAHRRADQRLLGQWLEFRTRASLGFQYTASGPGWPGLIAECGYEHISNAGMSHRNLGADNLAFRLGLSWPLPGANASR